jgi:hypothetical protein
MSTATCDQPAGAVTEASKTTEPSGFWIRDVRSTNSMPAYGSLPSWVYRRSTFIRASLERTREAREVVSQMDPLEPSELLGEGIRDVSPGVGRTPGGSMIPVATNPSFYQPERRWKRAVQGFPLASTRAGARPPRPSASRRRDRATVQCRGGSPVRTTPVRLRRRRSRPRPGRRGRARARRDDRGRRRARAARVGRRPGPGARHIEIERVASRAPELPRDRPVAFLCRAGVRAGMVATAFAPSATTPGTSVAASRPGTPQACRSSRTARSWPSTSRSGRRAGVSTDSSAGQDAPPQAKTSAW